MRKSRKATGGRYTSEAACRLPASSLVHPRPHGNAINIAKAIHAIQALLATGFVFPVHFFNTHVRPDRFPADLSVSTGFVSEEKLKQERPEWYARTAREGGLKGLGAVVPSAKRLWLYRLAGFVPLVIGLGLLAGIVFPSLSG